MRRADWSADGVRFFEYVALTVLLRNGDGHLKNFGVVYHENRVRLAPVFDVVTTTLYDYERSTAVRTVDRTMALKLRKDGRTKPYPLRDELDTFGKELCGVSSPDPLIEKIAGAMDAVLENAAHDARIAVPLLQRMAAEWRDSIAKYRFGENFRHRA